MTAAAWSLGAAGPVLAAEVPKNLDWHDRAACKGADWRLFFTPNRHESNAARERRERQAKAMCARCPVMAACRADAMHREAGFGHETRGGILGGLNEHDRCYLEKHGTVPVRTLKGNLPPGAAPIPDLTAAEIALFWSRTRPGGCGTEWNRGVTKEGFGFFRTSRAGGLASRRVAAHRLAYKLATGTDPGADNIVQSCGNRRCLTAACLATVPAISRVSQRSAA